MAPGLARRVTVERVADATTAVEHIAKAARAGAAVAWVRNAVDDAIEAHAALRAVGVNAMLFHARFAMGDRQDIRRHSSRSSWRSRMGRRGRASLPASFCWAVIAITGPGF
jgi:CRISPR-associated endonuclease/helicase Cas3